MRCLPALATLLALAACTGSPPPQATMTRGTVPRDGRGNAVLDAVKPPPPPAPPPPAEFKPATAPPVSCQHLRHC
jgi:hypothetical protein